MFDLFTDIFTYRDNILARVDARAKLVIALAAMLAVILSTTPKLPAGVLIICVAVMIFLRIPLRLITFRMAAPMGVVIVLIIVQSLMSGSTPVLSFNLGSLKITAMREGLSHGLLLGARVLGAVSVMLLMSFVTPAHKIFQALTWFKVSRGWVEIAILMYRYIFGLMDRVADIGSAQKLRLGYTGLRRSFSSAGTLAGATIIHSLDQAGRTHEAMMMRGYKGHMPFRPLPRMRRRDRIVTVIALLVLSAAYVIAERGTV
jgi:cobalt/nickel transport system permease protein